MRLKKEFVTVLNDDGSITVSTDTKLFSGMIRNNKTATKIIRYLEEETSVEDIAKKLCEVYEADFEIVKKDVEEIIDKLRSIGAIDD